MYYTNTANNGPNRRLAQFTGSGGIAKNQLFHNPLKIILWKSVHKINRYLNITVKNMS